MIYYHNMWHMRQMGFQLWAKSELKWRLWPSLYLFIPYIVLFHFWLLCVWNHHMTHQISLPQIIIGCLRIISGYQVKKKSLLKRINIKRSKFCMNELYVWKWRLNYFCKVFLFDVWEKITFECKVIEHIECFI